MAERPLALADSLWAADNRTSAQGTPLQRCEAVHAAATVPDVQRL